MNCQRKKGRRIHAERSVKFNKQFIQRNNDGDGDGDDVRNPGQQQSEQQELKLEVPRLEIRTNMNE